MTIEQRQSKIVNNELHNATEILREVLNDIILINKERQFDYVSSPELSNEFDSLNSIVKKIDCIIYQKK